VGAGSLDVCEWLGVIARVHAFAGVHASRARDGCLPCFGLAGLQS
jgi:hypothetical protein